MTKKYVLDLRPSHDGNEALVFSRELSEGVSAQIGLLNLGRPARHGALDPDFLLASGLIMFGEYVHGQLSVRFRPSDAYIRMMSRLWSIDVVVEDASRFERIAPTEVAEFTRSLIVSEDLGCLVKGDMNSSHLIVLPKSRFNGQLGTMFSLAVSTNAIAEASRLHGEDQGVVGLISLGVSFLPAVKASTLIVSEGQLQSFEMRGEQLSTLSVLGVKVVEA